MRHSKATRQRRSLLLRTRLLSWSTCVALAFGSGLTQASPLSPSEPGRPTQTDADQMQIAQSGYQRIGGIEQWITITGDDRSHPVILFLHGGPGNPLSPFAANVYAGWQRDFTLVQWDQRGAGKTYARNPGSAEAPLTLAQMVADGIEVAEWVSRHLGQRRIILMGSSWGSVLGLHMAKQRPDLFLAYVGTAQMVSYQANMAASYSQTLARALEDGDTQTAQALQAIGPPPHSDPRAFGVLRRAVRTHEGKRSDPAPRHWWQPAPGYDSAADLAQAEEAEEYSFIQFVGFKGNGIFSKVNLPSLGVDFKIPLHFVQGQEDLLTPSSVTRPFVDGLTAPAKSFLLVAQAGHDPNPAIVAAQHRMLKGIIKAD